MPAGLPDRIQQEGPQLLRQCRQLLFVEPAQVSRAVDGVEQRRGGAFGRNLLEHWRTAGRLGEGRIVADRGCAWPGALLRRTPGYTSRSEFWSLPFARA